MRKHTVKIHENAEKCSRAIANAIAEVVREAVATRGRCYMALAGGHSPQRTYQLLSSPPLREQVEWSRVEFFWGDERPVPPDHPDSNYRMARLALLDPLHIPDERRHRMMAEAPD